MYRATTPTITFKFPDTINMLEAEDVYVTFSSKKKNYKLTKRVDDGIIVTEHTVVVTLSQEETLRFMRDVAETQVNWLYREGSRVKRACSQIVELTVHDNLLDKVIE